MGISIKGLKKAINTGRVHLFSQVISAGAVGGSMLFNGVDTELMVGADMEIGTGDFTIEWFQYQTDSGSFPRVFSIGSYPGASAAVSLESGILYFWGGLGSAITSAEFSSSPLNVWTHFAITRESGDVRIFQNGTQIGAVSGDSTYIGDPETPLIIGGETTDLASGTLFNGNITNMRWVNGTALYTSAFSVPNAPLIQGAGTTLLLLATDEAGLLTDQTGKSITQAGTSNVTWSPMSPFGPI